MLHAQKGKIFDRRSIALDDTAAEPSI